MLCVRAPHLEKQLVELVRLTGKTKSHYVRAALQAFLNALDHYEPRYVSEFRFETSPQNQNSEHCYTQCR